MPRSRAYGAATRSLREVLAGRRAWTTAEVVREMAGSGFERSQVDPVLSRMERCGEVRRTSFGRLEVVVPGERCRDRDRGVHLCSRAKIAVLAMARKRGATWTSLDAFATARRADQEIAPNAVRCIIWRLCRCGHVRVVRYGRYEATDAE